VHFNALQPLIFHALVHYTALNSHLEAGMRFLMGKASIDANFDAMCWKAQYFLALRDLLSNLPDGAFKATS
jgi:hypothetical protein